MTTERPTAGGRAGGVTLSVVSHRQGALVQRLLQDLADLRPAALASVVVTRNLPDDPIRVPEGTPWPVRLLDNDRARGFGANHNRAFAVCHTDWFAIVNPDIRLPDDPFAPMLASAAPGTGLVAPAVCTPAGAPEDSARALITPVDLLRRRLASRAEAPRPPAWFAGMFLLVRSGAFRAVGGFDERFRMYCEDADLCARLRLAGWALAWAPEARVVHDARRASRRSPRHFAWHVASLLRHWGSPAFWRYRALLARERAGAPAAARGHGPAGR